MEHACDESSFSCINFSTVNLDVSVLANGIASELTVTPKARSVATRAGLLAKAAKGRSKNVVTAKVIKNAAKALKIGAIMTASGVKLAGEVQSQNVNGYMCVCAVKKRAVVKNC